MIKLLTLIIRRICLSGAD